MLDVAEISRIAERAARGQSRDVKIEQVLAEPITDSLGDDALRVVFVLAPDSIDRWTGDNALDLLVELRRRLFAGGEYRVPIIEYATPEEIAGDIAEADNGEG